MNRFFSVVLAVVLAAGCTGEPDGTLDTTTPTGTSGLAVLGGGSNDVSELLEVVVKRRDGLANPQDLAFNPDVNGELWLVSRDDDSTTIVDDAGSEDQVSETLVDPFALHFMEQVSSIAFGAPGTFATCQDSRNTYNGRSEANDFMGPSLWSSDRAVFAKTNPYAVDFLGFDLGSHLDMLHESPQCMGIAWDHDNVYWVFDGFHDAIARYDFQVDHGAGFDDHSDGIIGRWVAGEVSRVNGVVSHLVLDHDSGLLYIADTGNNRIAVLDTASGRRGDTLSSKEPGVDHHMWNNGDLTTLVDGEALGMLAPAGIELIDDMLFVTDNGTGYLHAFDLEGNEIDWADTGKNGLAGIYAVSADELWIVNASGNEVLRLRP